MWIVFFYSSATPRLIKIWSKFANTTRNIIKVGAVDCVKEKALCRKFVGAKKTSILLCVPDKKKAERFPLEKGAKAQAEDTDKTKSKDNKNNKKGNNITRN